MGSLLRAIVFSLAAFIRSVLPMPTYTEGVIGQPVTFNPVKVGTNQVDRDISSLVFRGLLHYDEKGVLTGDLAESWTIDTEGREYIFKLKNGLVWQDGAPLTADDILYTVSQYPQLKEIQADKLNQQTVRFQLKEPLAPFLDILTLGVIPAHIGDRLDDLRPVGSSEFRVIKVKKTKIIDEVVLQGKTSRIIFSFYPSKIDLLSSAKLGELDGFLYSGAVAGGDWPNYNLYQLPLKNRYYALFLNLNMETLKDLELRKALAQSTPKELIVKDVFKGAAQVVEGPLDGSEYESETYHRYTYQENLDKNYNLNLTLTVPKKIEHLETAELIKKSWEKIGVHLEIIPVDADKITSSVISEKKFDVLLLGQEVSRDPDRYTLWHSTQKDLPGLNFVGLKQVRIDRSLEDGRKAIDPEVRKNSYIHFQDVFAEEVPAIFLYRPVVTYLVKKKITPVDFSPVFTLSDRFNGFANWKIE